MRDVTMRIVICDDEAKICEQYARKIRTILEENHLPPIKIDTYNSGIDLLEEWQWQNSDVLFLDVRMPDKDGVEVAYELRAKGFQGTIIFLTVSKRHAVEAFNVDAFYYLVKGDVDTSQITKVFLKAYWEIAEQERKYITLTRGGELRKIAIDSIYYFELKNRRMAVHYQEDEEFYFYSTLEKIEKALAGDGFVRVHQGYLIALRYVRKSEDGKGIDMANGDRVPIGIRYANQYEKALTERDTAC